MWYKVIPSNNGYYIKCTCDLPLFGFFDEDHKQWKQVRLFYFIESYFSVKILWSVKTYVLQAKDIQNSLKEPKL